MSSASWSYCVFRGGSRFDGPQYARVTNRYYYTPDSRNYNLGVRLMRKCT